MIDPEHLPDVVRNLQANGEHWHNVGGCPHDVTDITGGNYTALERCRRCKATRDGYGYSNWSPPLVWREAADARCDCVSGYICAGTPDAAECPDCRGTSKPLHTLTAPCLNDCYPVGSGPCSACATYPHGPGGPHVNTGFVSVEGVVVAELAPYYERGQRIPEPWMRHVGPGRNDEMWLWHGPNMDVPENLSTGRPVWKHTRITTSGPPLSPGDWVAHLKVVT